MPGGWLFPGLDPMDPLTSRQLNRAVHGAADGAVCSKQDARVCVSVPGDALRLLLNHALDAVLASYARRTLTG
jgi:hypothetical protein